MKNESLGESNNIKKFNKNFVRITKEKKEEDKDIKEILLYKKDNLLCYGAKLTIKNFKKNNVKKVYLSTNCSEMQRDMIKHYCKISNADFVELVIDNFELSQKLEKPFLIGVVMVLKNKKEDKK